MLPYVAVSRQSLLLASTLSALQRGWEVATLPREAGGLGLSEEVARRRVASQPMALQLSRESMQKRAAFLETLGVPDGRSAIARDFSLLGLAEDTLRSKAEWLLSQGLDVNRILSTHSSLLKQSAKALFPKLDFMLNVVSLEFGQIVGRFLSASLDSLRHCFFYAMQRAERRYTFSTLIQCSDAAYVKRVDGLPLACWTGSQMEAALAYKAASVKAAEEEKTAKRAARKAKAAENAALKADAAARRAEKQRERNVLDAAAAARRAAKAQPAPAARALTARQAARAAR